MHLAVGRSVDPKNTDSKTVRPSTAPPTKTSKFVRGFFNDDRPLRSKDCRMLKRQQIYSLHDCESKCLEKSTNFFLIERRWSRKRNGLFLVTTYFHGRGWRKKSLQVRGRGVLCSLETEYRVDGKEIRRKRKKCAVQKISRMKTILIILSTQIVYSCENVPQRTKILMQHIAAKFWIGWPYTGRD